MLRVKSRVNKFLVMTQASYYGIGRVLIYLLAAAFACDWTMIVKRLTNIRVFVKRMLSAGVTYYLAAYYLDKELDGCNSVLDLGCGQSSWLQVFAVPYSLGVDAWEASLKESKSRKLHTQYVLADVRSVEFKERSFDAVVAFEVVEHLTKEEARKLISNMERWARKKIIVSTPSGYVHRDAVDGNPFQRHMSGWDITELKQLGFEVHGALGWRALRDKEGMARFKPEIVWQTISSLTSIILYNLPELSFDLFCVKAIKQQ